ncbi:TIGR03086 family metal-binding protein [Actinoallomurus purpureus]|uniref:TIGR03086 family metal-binding protein n=1 Tax=Actinoallomurus purpureus TaxID=478114 RepID=UPI002092AA51|nr:TIGR03086 family metal-binding protein [Actinoallomurus purpureus]MCO6008078.1 TIGR03086 family metal-binding protein [Actinoallomurus purpureus]
MSYPSSPERLGQSINLFMHVLTGVSVDQYGDATPCAAFTVRDLVNHVAKMFLMTEAIGTGTEWDPSVATADPMPFLAETPESGWPPLLAERAQAAAKTWADPQVWEGEASLSGSLMATATVGGILIAEFTVHAWDLAVATGRFLRIPDHLAASSLEIYRREAPRMRGLGLLADEVMPDADASLFDQVLALSGRDPRWGPPPRAARDLSTEA